MGQATAEAPEHMLRNSAEKTPGAIITGDLEAGIAVAQGTSE